MPVLGVPDALVPLDLPVSQLSLFPGYDHSLIQFLNLVCGDIAVLFRETEVAWIASCCRETSVIWVSIDVPNRQPPGQYEGEIIVSAMKTDGG